MSFEYHTSKISRVLLVSTIYHVLKYIDNKSWYLSSNLNLSEYELSSNLTKFKLST